MAFIDQVEVADASGELAQVYEKIGATRGGVANVLKVQSLHPESLDKHFDFYKSIMFSKSPLSRRSATKSGGR
ncbi:MAG: peroxidase [Planctomycetes bacterium]|nr:peroxidase [Planctomycetota bacterium]